MLRIREVADCRGPNLRLRKPLPATNGDGHEENEFFHLTMACSFDGLTWS